MCFPGAIAVAVVWLCEGGESRQGTDRTTLDAQGGGPVDVEGEAHERQLCRGPCTSCCSEGCFSVRCRAVVVVVGVHNAARVISSGPLADS